MPRDILEEVAEVQEKVFVIDFPDLHEAQQVVRESSSKSPLKFTKVIPSSSALNKKFRMSWVQVVPWISALVSVKSTVRTFALRFQRPGYHEQTGTVDFKSHDPSADIRIWDGLDIKGSNRSLEHDGAMLAQLHRLSHVQARPSGSDLYGDDGAARRHQGKAFGRPSTPLGNRSRHAWCSVAAR